MAHFNIYFTMVSASFNATDVARINKAFGSLIKETSDWSYPLKNSARYTITTAQRNFDTQGFTLNSRWSPLKPSTVRARVKQGLGARPILIRTRKLQRGFRIEGLNSTSVKVINPVEYALYHQEGTRKMVARKIIGFPVALKKAIATEFTNFLRQKVAINWGKRF